MGGSRTKLRTAQIPILAKLKTGIGSERFSCGCWSASMNRENDSTLAILDGLVCVPKPLFTIVYQVPSVSTFHQVKIDFGALTFVVLTGKIHGSDAHTH
jgi:hypothetical protein